VEPYTEEIEPHSIWEFRWTGRDLCGFDATAGSRPDLIQLAGDLRVVEREAPSRPSPGRGRAGLHRCGLHRCGPSRRGPGVRSRDGSPARGPRGRTLRGPGPRFLAQRPDRVRGWTGDGRRTPPRRRARPSGLSRPWASRSPRRASPPVARGEALPLAELAARLHSARWDLRDLHLQHVVERQGYVEGAPRGVAAGIFPSAGALARTPRQVRRGTLVGADGQRRRHAASAGTQRAGSRGRTQMFRNAIGFPWSWSWIGPVGPWAEYLARARCPVAPSMALPW